MDQRCHCSTYSLFFMICGKRPNSLLCSCRSGGTAQFPLYSRNFGGAQIEKFTNSSISRKWNHITLDIHSVDRLLQQLKYFSSCKLRVKSCTVVVTMNYCNSVAHVRTQPKLTNGAVLSAITAIRCLGVQKDYFTFILVFISL
jgi:hypothetical protein